MDNSKKLNYFLGANTSLGFYSHFDGLANNHDDFLWVIKGGPGNGKSGFMKKIAAAATNKGYDVEYAFCSGDPSSVDGIYIPQLKTGYVDGTAPHTTEVNIAACNSSYIDLGTFYRISEIVPLKDGLEYYFAKNKDCYKRAYAFLSAAGSVKKAGIDDNLPETVKRRLNGLANRNFKKKSSANGSIKRLFLSTHTCEGHTVYLETLHELCEKAYVIDSSLGYAPKALDILANNALAAGYDIIMCQDPILPKIAEAVIIPELSLSFINSASPLSEIEPSKRVRLDIYASSDELHVKKAQNRKCSKIMSSLLSEVYESLSEAKSYHDEIEKIYNPHVDFDGVYSVADKHIAMHNL